MKRLLIGFILTFGLFAIKAQADTNKVLEKEYQETFSVTDDSKLDVKNIYGDVFVNSWDKNEIKVDVMVKVESSTSSSKATDIFNNIEIEITQNGGLVQAITHFPSFRGSGSYHINIDYYISLPSTVQLDIEQKYGNVILNNNWTASTRFEVNYGNLQVRDLKNNKNEIEVSYGEFLSEGINCSEIEISYSDIQIESVEKLDLKTSYCDVEIGKVGSLELKSGFDDVEIEEVTDLFGRANYSDIDIDKLTNSIEIDLDFGDIDIDYVGPEFRLIKIDSNNAGVDIDVDDNASYYLEVLTRYGELETRDERSIKREKLSFSSFKYTGNVGNSKNAGEIIIDASYATVEIK